MSQRHQWHVFTTNDLQRVRQLSPPLLLLLDELGCTLLLGIFNFMEITFLTHFHLLLDNLRLVGEDNLLFLRLDEDLRCVLMEFFRRFPVLVILNSCFAISLN